MALTSLVAANAAAAAAGAGKKAAQVQLQADLNTDDDWTKFLNREGLLVVDVYSEWCGPCIGMVGNLKKMKVELGGDNLHLAIARSDTIDCLKRFRNRSEPTWMFIAAGKLLNVVFGADAPRLARTIEQELKHEEQARKGERERPERRPDELTPHEQEVADAQEKLRQDKLAREEAAVQEARLQRREARAKRLEAHFSEICPALMMPHSQKHLRKVADALEPLGVLVADKCPLLVGKDSAKVLAAEDETFAAPAAQTALVERPSLTLLLKKMPDKEGEVIELVRRALCGDGVQTPEGEKPKKHLVEELTADGVPGLFIPVDRHQRAVILDLLFPKMVGVLVEPPLPPEPPHVAMTFGAWQRRAVLAAAAAPDTAPCVLRSGFFADASVDEPRLLAKTLDKYEERPEKDYCETLILMVSVGSAEPLLFPAAPGPPPSLVRAGALRVSADAVAGAQECARYFPPGYSEPEPKPKLKCKRKKKKRENKEDTIDKDPTAETTPASETVETEAGEGEVEGEVEAEAEAEGEGGAEEGEEEEGEGEEGGVDKATSPPPQPPPE